MMDLKLKLEKVYEEYCVNELVSVDGCYNGENEEIKMLFEFVKFRLRVSGGSESNMSVSMFNVNNFLEEIFLFDNMMCDFGGCYRGEFSSEGLEWLKDCLDKNNVDDDIKEMIIKGYRDYNEMDNED